MNAYNAGFYFLLLAVLILEGGLLSHIFPEQSRMVEEDRNGARLGALDGLRGILALSVLASHCALYHHVLHTGEWKEQPSHIFLQAGFISVNLFFFITGYLFWKKLGRKGSIPFAPFLAERARRLGGVYWTACLILFVSVAIQSHFHRNVSYGTLAAQIAGWLSYIGARRILNGIPGSDHALGQVWTLRIEWMFYLSLPFLGWFARRRSRLPILLVAAAVITACIAKIPAHGTALNFVLHLISDLTSNVAQTFSVGMLLAVIPVSERLTRLARSAPAAVLSLLLIGITAVWVPPAYGEWESLFLAIPFACVVLGNNWFGLLTTRAVSSLGRVSYSLYLLHTFVLQFGLRWLGTKLDLLALSPVAYWCVAGILSAVAVLVSFVSFRFLELPFLKPASRNGAPLLAPLESPERPTSGALGAALP